MQLREMHQTQVDIRQNEIEISHARDNHIYATDTHCRMVWYEFCPYAGAFIAVWICGYLRHLSADCVD